MSKILILGIITLALVGYCLLFDWRQQLATLRGFLILGVKMGKPKKTPEDYHSLADRHGFEWIGETIINVDTPTQWRCKGNHEFETRYSDLSLGKSGCPHCSGVARKTPEDYHEMAERRGFKWLGPEVSSVFAKTTWECINKHQWPASWSTIRKKRGCPHCGKRAKKTEADYHTLAQREGLKWLGPMVKRVVYKTNWECSNLHQFPAKYNDIDQGGGCPHCAGNIRKSPDDYHNLARSRQFEWLGPEVRNIDTLTEWRCSKRNHHWMGRYHDIAGGHGCPKCDQSKGEDTVAEFLDRLNILYQTERRFDDCRDINPLPFDFCAYIGGAMILIEFDGEQHIKNNKFFGGQGAFEKRQLHDQIRNAYAAAHNIPLIRIPHTVKAIEAYLQAELEKHLGYSLDTLQDKNTESEYNRPIAFNPYRWQQLSFGL